MAKDVKRRIVMRSFIVNTYKADQMLRHGIVNEDGSVDQTGHKQVPIKYDKNLFQVEDESGRLLEEIIVDEGMVDLLKAVWRHGIPTNHSCQGREGEPAWIRFESFEYAGHFHDLVPHTQGEKWRLSQKCEVSFPQESIAKITEELNKQAVTQTQVTQLLNNIHITTK